MKDDDAVKTTLLGALAAGLAATALAASSPFPGTYKGADVVLEIKETAAGQFAGTVASAGQVLRFAAREEEGALVGALNFGDEKIPFRMTLKGVTLTFASGEESQTLTRQEGAPATNLKPPALPGTAATNLAGARAEQVFRVNGVVLAEDRVRKFEQENKTRLPCGDFWYDKVSGGWGLAGGPTLGFTAPGLDLGGPLKADASRGNTGAFINGRELPMLDVLALQSLGVPVLQGRWWVDHTGNVGVEGNPQVLGNLFQFSRGKGGSYQRATAGGYIGGDGHTSYFFDPKSGSSVMVGQ
jgi:hypothetical protein